MQPYPRAPDLVWPGHLHGAGWLSAWAIDSGFPTVVWRLCLGLGFAVAFKSWLVHWVGVLGYGFWFRPSIPGLGLWFVRLGLGFGLHWAIPGWGFRRAWLCARSACTPPFLARVCGVCVCGWAQVSAAPRHSWLGCWAACVFVCALCFCPATPGLGVQCGCVLGLRFRLRPATPG